MRSVSSVVLLSETADEKGGAFGLAADAFDVDGLAGGVSAGAGWVGFRVGAAE